MFSIPSQCLLLSIRLSSAAVHYIFDQTGATIVVASSRTRRSIEDAPHKEGNPSKIQTDIITAAPFGYFLSPSVNASKVASHERTHKQTVRESDRYVLILHSSGTTGTLTEV